MKKLEFKLLKKKLPKGINLVSRKELRFKIFTHSKKNLIVRGIYDPTHRTIYLREDADYWVFYHERIHAYIDKYFWSYLMGFIYIIEEVIVALITGIAKWFDNLFKGK